MKVFLLYFLILFINCKSLKSKKVTESNQAGLFALNDCLVESKSLPEPLGIENEKNFCYLISLMQALAPIRVLYNQFYKCGYTEDAKDPVACQCYRIIKKIRSGKRVSKPDISKLITVLCKTGWLEEHGTPRFRDDPRDPSFLLKFFLDRLSKKYLRLMSIINENPKKVNYCVDEGENYDNIDISCNINKFEAQHTNTNVLILISLYEGQNSTNSISYKSLSLTIPKEHANTQEDLKYKAVSFIHVKSNMDGSNHATAYVYRKDNITNKKIWYHCNDNQVHKCNEDEIKSLINSENTLIILYERCC